MSAQMPALMPALLRPSLFALPLWLLSLAATAPASAEPLLALQAAQADKLGLRTAKLQAATDTGRVTLQGQITLPPQLLRVVSAPAAGLIEQVHVAKGDAVAAKRPLVSLHAPQLVEWQREHRQAVLQEQLARQTAQRDQSLQAEGIVSSARSQASHNQWLIAQAAVKERAQLLQMAGTQPDTSGGLSGRVALSAPAKGTVVEMLVEPGQRVEAGAPLLKFASAGALWIDLKATAEVARRLQVGDEVRINGCAMPARLSAINPQLDSSNQTLSLRAQWPQANDCAWPQQQVQAEVVLSQRDTPASQSQRWLVPASAVLKHEGQDTVFVQRPGGFMGVSVKVLGQQTQATTTQGQSSSWLQLQPVKADGLKAQDKVVVQGAVALKGLAQGLGAP
jgi:cobalt-zinc-cadmium efflux system membrane fusion protein